MDGGTGFNFVYAGKGNDTLISLNGVSGNWLEGSSGNDTYIIDSVNDYVGEYAGGGYDRVLFRGMEFRPNFDDYKNPSPAYQDPDLVYIEEIEEIIFDGNSKTSVVVSGTATSTIIRTKDGSDTIYSYGGNDTIQAGGGHDSINGGKANDKLYGEAGDDELMGDAGDDLLDGGTGADRLKGGIGNDRYVVDNAGDLVLGEVSGGGFDVIETAVLNTMALKDTWNGTGSDLRFIEGVSYTGYAAATLTGNGLDNQLTALWAAGADIEGGDGKDVIWGSGKADVLDGGDDADTIYGRDGDDHIDGGFGVDAMHGGLGNDTYVVNASTDKVVELGGQGYDTVRSWVNYVLSGNVERGELLADSGGTLVGNDLGNALYGSKTGVNTVSGGGGDSDTLIGGTGDDAMHGLTGNDTYHVDSMLDVVVEWSNSGQDTIVTSVSYGLNDKMSGNVENLTAEQLSKSFILIGNSLDNTIRGAGKDDTLGGEGGKDVLFGYSGADVLSGGKGVDALYGGLGNDKLYGGQDNDTMYGGDGADTFYFMSGDGKDVVWDFQDGLDRIAVTGATMSDVALDETVDGVAISFDGLDFSVLLAGISPGAITAADFVFL
jgi:Ca2+-binding RTX toxin-like protein